LTLAESNNVAKYSGQGCKLWDGAKDPHGVSWGAAGYRDRGSQVSWWLRRGGDALEQLPDVLVEQFHATATRAGRARKKSRKAGDPWRLSYAQTLIYVPSIHCI
jgi:hypothetical protein